MGLSEDIQQREFVNEQQKVLINLLYTYNHVINEMNVFFKQHDLTRQQYNVLRILRGQFPKPSTINLIKERMLDKMSDASRIVQRLEQKSLIERKISFDDRRSVEIRIADAGLLLLAQTDESVKGFTHLAENLSDSEAKQLNFLLDKMRK
ncbi:MarR family transcriptional regulator [Fulvivirga sp. M361]|uniref:MarR family winged helix-turn-helix transcriptional regulator n=1 Tax=Fulvivirga sp. M361 TaxID=2594266 RepID=UPI00117AA7C1|nr:MarR family transcriptional regulator [Fulvivirga sp. M361]TRX60832.1 MarR family transcriptional regulator [Fulvivirga sp. M361]